MSKLGEVCTLFSGTGFPVEYQGSTIGKYPFYKVGDIAKNVMQGFVFLTLCDNYIDEDICKLIKGKVIPENTIVFAKIGEAVKLNRRAITTVSCLIDNNVMGIKPNETILNLRYFYHFMCNLKLEEYAEVTTVPSVKKTIIEKIEIPLLTIEEQKKIATNLDKVTHTIDLCNQIIEKLDLLVKARFVEMFGDPVSNPMSWQTKPLLSIGKCKNGMNFHYDDNGVEINCLGVGDFKDLSIITDTSALPKISLNEMPTDEYLLKNNDIVFVRSNGNKALVGRSLAVYPDDIPTTFSGFCIRFRKDDDSILIPYLLRVLKTDSIRKKMAGRGANIQNLNQQILSTLEIPVPPLELQQKFADFIKQTEKSKSAVKKVLEKTETLKKALMQEYFG